MHFLPFVILPYKRIIAFVLFCIPAISYGHGSLYFTENKKQWPSNILYQADLQSARVYLERNCLTYLLWDNLAHPGESDEQALKLHALRMHFVNANPDNLIQHEKPQPFYKNYFIGNDPEKWAGGVQSYSEITYKDLYPLTDLKIYSEGVQLKYDLIVQPGGDPSVINFKWEGAEKMFLEGEALYIRTSVNTLAEQKPFAYQLTGNDTVPVACRFVLDHTTVSYAFPEGYNENFPLVIDPVLVFSSFTGSAADNFGFTATYDTLGNLYAGGTAFAPGYPITTGAYQPVFGGPTYDISISKFNPSGSLLLYSTYLGGDSIEAPQSIVVNNLNELVVLGRTLSADFPVTALAFDKKLDSTDICLSRFNIDGTQLLASTLIGGTGHDGINVKSGVPALNYNFGDASRSEVIVDELDRIYVVANTQSADFPVTSGAFQPVFGGIQDACVFVFDKNLATLQWSTFLGGTGKDGGYSLVLDQVKNIYLGGGTASPDFPVTPGARDESFNGEVDGYIACLNATGSSLLYSTLSGTSLYDQVYFVELDNNQDVYCVGQTEGTYPVSLGGVYSNTDGKIFIQKFNPQLSAISIATVIGSGGSKPNISPTAFLVDDCERIYVSGWGGKAGGGSTGNTTGLPVTANAFQSTTDGSDFYFIVLDKDATQLLYATYFGGPESEEHVDGGTSRFDKKGIIYQSVCAGCGANNDFPTTPGAWSNTNNSNNCNNAVLKFNFQFALSARFEAEPRSGCGPLTVNFNNGSVNAVNYEWDLGDGNTSASENPSNTYTLPGLYTIRLIASDPGSCNPPDTVFQQIKVFDTLTFQASKDTFLCPDQSYKLSDSAGDPFLTYLWSPAAGLSDPSVPDPVADPDSSTVYILTVSTSNCTVKDTVEVKVDTLNADFMIVRDSCNVFSFVNTSVNSEETYWFFGDGDSSSMLSPSHSYNDGGEYEVMLVIISKRSCTDTATQKLTIEKFREDGPFIPNVFTPNNDGKNDLFEFIPGKTICTLDRLIVFSRWGERLFEGISPDVLTWDGKKNGVLMPEGTYFFIAEGKGFKKAGSVLLKL